MESEQRALAEALRDTASALNQSLNLREVLDCILSKVGLVVQNDAANIMLVEGGVARMAACRGYEKLGGEKRVMGQVRVIQDVPNLRKMVETGRPIVVPDTRYSADWVDFDTSYWIRSYASVPIRRKGKTIGVLNLNSATPGLYRSNHAERLLAFADQAAIAIENARLYESAQQEIADRKRAEEALQEAMNKLELRVEERTAELKRINEQLKTELLRRMQAEKALEEERSMLAIRIEERTAEISKVNAELAKAVRMKDAFLANMSHELRTPLNAILNLSETLQEQVFGELNETQLRSVRTIEESGRHLLTLINDILDLSKIGAGKFELNLDGVSVMDLCRASLEMVNGAARKKQITVSVSIDPNVKTIWADQRRLKQVLVNLLSNAVKFTPPLGTIGLDVTGDVEKRAVKFSVWDTGIGIPQESMGYLFKPFVQLDNSLSRHYEGTGLGLALVYHIVELHGGGVSVESTPGKGSRFTVTLCWDGEMEEDLATGDAQLRQSLPGGTGRDASLFDGDIRRLLNEIGIETRYFWFETDLVERIGQFAPDFLILDARLATRHRGLIERLRQEPATRGIPVIVIGDARNRPDVSQLPGSVGYLEKPFQRQQLRRLLKEHSPKGTASLVHRAALLQENNTNRREWQPTILIADDNETSVRVLYDYLMLAGFKVVAAYNGAEAIEKAREAAPALILMDIQMPGMDGLEAIRRIRSDARIKDIPIIAFTALAMPGDRARCLAAGANEYLSKPLSLKNLVGTIESYLQKQSESEAK